jgi:hypothetical protein
MNVRPITDADIEAVAALAVEDEAVLQGRPSCLGTNDVRGFFVGIVAQGAKGRGLGAHRRYRRTAWARPGSRGVPRVTLGVDAESSTGATKLYESVGMTTENATVVYEKALA